MKKLLCLSLMLLTPILYSADMASITVHTQVQPPHKELINGPVLTFDVDLQKETLNSLAKKISKSPALKADDNFKAAQFGFFYWYKNNQPTDEYLAVNATLHEMGISKGQDIFAGFTLPLILFKK